MGEEENKNPRQSITITPFLEIATLGKAESSKCCVVSFLSLQVAPGGCAQKRTQSVFCIRSSVFANVKKKNDDAVGVLGGGQVGDD